MFLRAMSLAMMFCLLAAPAAMAHFGMVIPDSNLMERPGVMTLDFRFWHPLEGLGMDLAKPAEVGVFLAGKKTSLLPMLVEKKVGKHTTWQAAYKVKRPGDYIFYMAPQPYWEPSEDCYIIHYSKTVVSALGAEDGWDQLLGLPLEILPLTRPYGLYAGNSFTGQVLYRGKPLAGAVVEVEFFNQKSQHRAPADSYVTQVVKTDSNGIFTWSFPWPGWWGMAALYTPNDMKMKKDGQDKDVELGGVLWLYAAPAGGKN